MSTTQAFCLCGASNHCTQSEIGTDHPRCRNSEDQPEGEVRCEYEAVKQIDEMFFCGYCAREWNKEHGPFEVGEMIEIAVFGTSLQYGGGEEGGWWYTGGSRDNFIRVPYVKDALPLWIATLIQPYEDVKHPMVDGYIGERDRPFEVTLRLPDSSVRPRFDGVVLTVNRKSVEGFPGRRPHYE